MREHHGFGTADRCHDRGNHDPERPFRRPGPVSVSREASAPNWVTASNVTTSQAPLDPGRQISTPRVLAVHSTVIVVV